MADQTTQQQHALQFGGASSSSSGMDRLGGHRDTSSDARSVVAQMAQQSRERAAAREAGHRSPATEPHRSNQSRSVQGGMQYLRRLRALDGIEHNPKENRVQPSHIVFEEPELEAEPWEALPWYRPPSLKSLQRRTRLAEAEKDHRATQDAHGRIFDPDGSNLDWYQMARALLASKFTRNDDPNGEREDDVAHSRDSLAVRRRIVGNGASNGQRLRNRSALVMADADAPSGHAGATSRGDIETWSYGEGWTLVDTRVASPPAVNEHESQHDGSRSSTWFRSQAFSTSPAPLAEAESSSAVPRRSATDAWLDARRPRRLGHLSPESLEAVHASNASLPQFRRITYAWPDPGQDEAATTRPQPTYPHPQRRAELWGRQSEGPHVVSRTRYVRPFVRETTPSPEPQVQEEPYAIARPASAEGGSEQSTGPDDGRRTADDRARISTIGARLEAEFRARQEELRVREGHLRAEVARRRLELDEIRRRQGRIGRIVEYSRDESGVQSPLLDPIQRGRNDHADSEAAVAVVSPNVSSIFTYRPQDARVIGSTPDTSAEQSTRHDQAQREIDASVGTALVGRPSVPNRSLPPYGQDHDAETTRQVPSDDIENLARRSLDESTPLLGDTPTSPSLVRRHALRESAPVSRPLRYLEARRSMLAAAPSPSLLAHRQQHASDRAAIEHDLALAREERLARIEDDRERDDARQVSDLATIILEQPSQYRQDQIPRTVDLTASGLSYDEGSPDPAFAHITSVRRASSWSTPSRMPAPVCDQ